jgi:hypothetical protein
MSDMTDLTRMSEEELRAELGTHIRMHDVAYRTLLVLAEPDFNDAELMHRHARMALDAIDGIRKPPSDTPD